jgi:hypothetical protein
MTREVAGSCFNAVAFVLVGGLMAFFRPGTRLLGGALVALGVIWALDASLAAYGTAERPRFRLRMALGIAVFLAAGVFWYSVRQ